MRSLFPFPSLLCIYILNVYIFWSFTLFSSTLILSRSSFLHFLASSLPASPSLLLVSQSSMFNVHYWYLSIDIFLIFFPIFCLRSFHTFPFSPSVSPLHSLSKRQHFFSILLPFYYYSSFSPFLYLSLLFIFYFTVVLVSLFSRPPCYIFISVFTIYPSLSLSLSLRSSIFHSLYFFSFFPFLLPLFLYGHPRLTHLITSDHPNLHEVSPPCTPGHYEASGTPPFTPSPSFLFSSPSTCSVPRATQSLLSFLPASKCNSINEVYSSPTHSFPLVALNTFI